MNAFQDIFSHLAVNLHMFNLAIHDLGHSVMTRDLTIHEEHDGFYVTTMS